MASLGGLEKLIAEIPGKTNLGVKKAMEFIYVESQKEVPVRSGVLKKTGRRFAIKNGQRLRYRAINEKNGYNYAPIQHENETFKHKVGKARYLSDPVEQNMLLIKKMIVKEIFR